MPYLFLLGSAYSVFAETVDDPYITFRYAAHLLAGYGPVFNIGERVEGYTSPLHLLLSAVLLTLVPSVDILFKSKCVSLLFAFVMLAQTALLARRSGLRGWETLLAQTLVALNINFALAGVNALETTLYGSLLIFGLLRFQQECRSGRGFASGLIFFLAILARPEAVLVAAALLILRLVWMRRRLLPSPFFLSWLGAFLVPVGLMEIARWRYYGDFLPNTYFAKAMPLRESLSLGVGYPLRALTPIITDKFFYHLSLLNRHNLLAFHDLAQRNIRFDFFSLSLPLLFWGLAMLGLWRTRRRVSGMVSLAVVIVVLAFVLKAGGDWMYGWRFMAPILPILAVCQCHAVRSLGSWLAERTQAIPARTTMRLCGAVIALVWLVSCVKTTHYSWKSANFSTQGSRFLQVSEGYGPLWVKGADYIEHLPRGTTVAYSEMGYAGYLNMDKSMLDIRGLTDREIAHLSAKYKYSTGVMDRAWYQPGDPLCQILQKRAPALIISLDGIPSGAALGGYQRGGILAMPTNGTQDLTSAYIFQRVR